jgi:predicted TIM-barrel fold metal-dependent hydrolase
MALDLTTLPIIDHHCHPPDRHLPPDAAQAVALKSIIAYRSGLAVTFSDERQAAAAFHAEQQRLTAPPRLTNKALLDLLLWHALERCAQRGLPCQLHTGFGDADVDLLQANPLLLRPLLQYPGFRHAPLILLHASYPYVREAGYVASLYAYVYVGHSLAIPLAQAGMTAILRMLLELAPTSKLLYGSDGHTLPEMYWRGARHDRAALASALQQLITEGLIESAAAITIAAQLLHQKARQLYRVG